MRGGHAVILFSTVLIVIALSVAPVSSARLLPLTTLCGDTEKIIFSCQLKSAKVISLCASSKFTKTEGYLQYRLGMPGKIELEYPKQRSESQKSFHYSHYFRAQFDLTEISFSEDGYTYSVFDNYNGEEKPAVTDQGVKVKPPNGRKEVTFGCRGKAKADFGDLSDLFENESAP